MDENGVHARERYTGHNLLFVVGCPRSGTTWLQRLLASHPSIHTGQESHLFAWYIGPQLRAWRKSVNSEQHGRGGGIGLACYLREEEFVGVLRRYAMELLMPMVGRLGPGGLFLEKTPSHALFLPEIRELLPESRVIHLLRDARDVVASMLAVSKSWGATWAPETPRKAAKTWVRHVRAARAAAEMFPPGQFLEVRYEELTARPHTALEWITRFLGLEWEPADIDSAIRQNSAKELRDGRGTPIRVAGHFRETSRGVVTDPPGFVRKARPGSWREDLSLIEKVIVWQVARGTMAETGYSWETDPKGSRRGGGFGGSGD